MSHTSTVPQTRTAISRSSSIILTPSKRRRISLEQPPRRAEHDAMQTSMHPKGLGKSIPDPTEVFRWTFTRAAIAPCFVYDALEMQQSDMKDMEFFWLGRIPCRTVHLVGLTVGVQVWEKRTVYTIDDGTGAIDCALSHAQVVPPSPMKAKSKALMTSKDTQFAKRSYSDYLLSARKVSHSVSSIPAKQSGPPSPPKPIACIGQPVRVVGRIVSKFDTRILLVDEISLCSSSNDEPNHWLLVSELHRTTYYPSEPQPAFVPPPLPTRSTYNSHLPSLDPYRSPKKHQITPEPQTPVSVCSTVSSTSTSPSTNAAASPPVSSAAEEREVPRLRHPSRLHSRDLTTNTFRIYVKHYMDNAPPPPHRRRSSEARPLSLPASLRSLQSRRKDAMETPTQARRRHNDATPRPSRLQMPVPDRTPRALPVSDISDEAEAESDVENNEQMYGYTLSHLRRVPELSLLARRVVRADARRRVKEERMKAKAQNAQIKAKPSSSAPVGESSDVPPGTMVKRLFKQAIRTLFQEGDIVLWNGPAHPIPPAPLLSVSSTLWKINSSTLTSRSSRSQPSYEEWDEEEVLSDPQPGEEAYVPVTPAYFSRVLEGAIRSIMSGLSDPLDTDSNGVAPKPPSKSERRQISLIDRLRALEKATTGPPSGPTKEELLSWLRNTDERWARVGEWTVDEALEWGRREGRLWCVGKGRWEVCG